VRLWALLRDRSLDGLKFRRQVPLGSYVVDFVSFRHRLVVEADGPFHDADRDAARDAWLGARGFKVLRFPNEQIEVWPDRVLDQIRAAVGISQIYAGPLSEEGHA
jgi:very-short-patch-repair endonuclease